MTTITKPFSGGCACGAVRYESTAEPVMMLHCHCRDCQQSSGGPFSSFVIVPTEAFKLLQGSLRFHASPSQMGGKTHRGFCPECGSPIQSKPDLVPHVVAIRTASLDDPELVQLASRRVDIRRATVGPNESRIAKVSVLPAVKNAGRSPESLALFRGWKH